MIQDSHKKEKLILEWKQIRARYFNVIEEDTVRFEQEYAQHPLYDSVKKHLDKSFKEVNQIAKLEIDNFLESEAKG